MSDADLLDPPAVRSGARAPSSDADLLDPPPKPRQAPASTAAPRFDIKGAQARAELRQYFVDGGRQDMVEAFDKQYGPPQAAAATASLSTVGQIPGAAPGVVAPPAQQEWTGKPASVGDRIIGGLETGAALATGATTGFAGGILSLIDSVGQRGLRTLAGMDTSQMPTTEQAFTGGMTAGTYAPRTEEGRSQMQNVMGSEAMRAASAIAPLRQVQLAAASVPVGMVARREAGRIGDAAQTVADQFARRAPIDRSAEPPMVAEKPRLVLRNGKIVPKEPAMAAAEAEVAGEVRAGAAPATVEARSISQPWRGNAAEGLANAPPELQAAITKAQKAGTLNPAAARRQIQAATLDVPVQLSKGHATLDARLLSEEMNGRAGKGVSVTPEFLQQQARDLAANLDVRRQAVAPEVTTTNPTQHGQALIDAAKKADAPERAAITQAYNELTTAAGGDLPIDGAAFVANADAALKKQLKSGAVPASIRSVMDDYKSGRQMTFEEFETLRTDLAQVIRDSGNGSERAAAKIIRQELEKLPLTPEAAALKPLADKARALNKARADKLDADPAYEAAVSDRVPIGDESPLADVFVDKYLIGGRRANIGTFQRNLAGDPLAKQTMAAATVDFLRTRAKADVEAGKFNADAYRNTLQRVGPKLDVLVDPDSAAKLQQVGDVAGYVTIQPRGSFVNNSNTLVGAAGEAGANTARAFLAVKTLGASEGVISGIQSARAARQAKASVAPGAGVDTGKKGGKLSDLGKP